MYVKISDACKNSFQREFEELINESSIYESSTGAP